MLWTFKTLSRQKFQLSTDHTRLIYVLCLCKHSLMNIKQNLILKISVETCSLRERLQNTIRASRIFRALACLVPLWRLPKLTQNLDIIINSGWHASRLLVIASVRLPEGFLRLNIFRWNFQAFTSTSDAQTFLVNFSLRVSFLTLHNALWCLKETLK